MAVAAPRRRADRDEDRVGLGHRRLQVGGEAQPPGLHVGGDQIVEARLVDRHLAALERRDLAGVLVDAGDVMAEIGKAGPGNEADIAGADHRDAHEVQNPLVNGQQPGYLRRPDGRLLAEAVADMADARLRRRQPGRFMRVRKRDMKPQPDDITHHERDRNMRRGSWTRRRSSRVDWVDYAKGFCIVMVVMMHSTLGVEPAAGHEGWMHAAGRHSRGRSGCRTSS